MAWHIGLTAMVWTVALFMLMGCDSLLSQATQGTPVVRATDGATASVVITTCPPSEARAFAVGELIQLLTQHDELAIARSGGTARLIINACPPERLLMPPALPPRVLR